MKILIEGGGRKIFDYPPLLLSKPADAIETKKILPLGYSKQKYLRLPCVFSTDLALFQQGYCKK
jgi:hypothetical protein